MELRFLRRRRKKKKTATATKDAISAITMPAIAGVFMDDVPVDEAVDGAVIVGIGLVDVDEFEDDGPSGVVYFLKLEELIYCSGIGIKIY
jgi:hypothetical protein